MILRALFTLVFWAAFFGLVGIVALGAVAIFHAFMTWLTGEEWSL